MLYQINQEQCNIRCGIGTPASVVRSLVMAALASAADKCVGSVPSASVKSGWAESDGRAVVVICRTDGRQQMHLQASWVLPQLACVEAGVEATSGDW
jgi:hypothetical protein